MRNGTPSHSASRILRSRVTPGRSSTIAACSPMMRLNNVDLPTFGRPTTATSGQLLSGHGRALPRERRAGPARPWRPPRPAAADRRPNRRRGSGRRRTGTRRAADSDARRARRPRTRPRSAADHQSAHARVAAEELVDDRDHPDIVTVQRGDERLQHLGAELAGQDADRRRAPRRQRDRRCGRGRCWSTECDSPSGCAARRRRRRTRVSCR